MQKQTKPEQNRQRLLDAGVELFSEHGFHGIGLKELLSTVNIPKGSFYNYFNSKEDFGVQVAEYYTEQFTGLLDATLGNTRVDGLTALKQFFRAAIQLFRDKEFRHGCLLGNFGAEISDTSEVCRRSVACAMNHLAGKFRDAIVRGQQDGGIRSDIKPKALADVLLNGWEGALLRMKMEHSGKPLENFRNVMINQLLSPQ